MTPSQNQFIDSLSNQVMMNYISDMLSNSIAITNSTFMLGIKSPVQSCEPEDLFDAFVSVLRQRLISKLEAKRESRCPHSP